MTDACVEPILYAAFQLLPSFPWGAYLNCILDVHWGVDRADKVKRLVRQIEGLADGQIELPGNERSFNRRIDFRLPDHNSGGRVEVMTNTYPAVKFMYNCFRLIATTLLPASQGDTLICRDEIGGLSQRPSYLWPLPRGMEHVQKLEGEGAWEMQAWVEGFNRMANEMVDADRVVRSVMERMQRSWYTSALLAYPQFDVAFPSYRDRKPDPRERGEPHTEFQRRVASYRPLDRKYLHRVIHKDDLPVVEKVFDQAAAGLRLHTAEVKLNLHIDRVNYTLET